MTDFKPGDRVYVTDPALAQLRAIMRNATGQEPAPNHHGIVKEVWDSGNVLIHFDDGGGAPYPEVEVRHLVDSTEVLGATSGICRALNPDRTFMCDLPVNHDGDHSGFELPTITLDEEF